jgi:hypothetical protein
MIVFSFDCFHYNTNRKHMQDRRKQQRYPLWKNFQPNIPDSREPGWILWHRGELTSGKLSEVTCITIAP